MILSYATIIAWENLPSAVVFLEVISRDGDRGIGSGFHLGGGLFATARHMVEHRKLLRIGRSDMSLKTSLGADGRLHQSTTFPAFSYVGPFESFFHPDERVDIAIIRLSGSLHGYGPVQKLQPAVRLTKHADALSPGELLFTEVLVLGFPPISCASDADLVAIRGVISSVINNRVDGRRHLILSGTARGGFSGGPVFLMGNPTVAKAGTSGAIENSGTVIGVVTTALTSTDESGNHLPTELGFMAATSISALTETMDYYGLDPRGA